MHKDITSIFHNEILTASSSEDCFIIIVFKKSNSSSYDLAVNIAQGASKYILKTGGKTDYHFTSFNNSKEQLMKLKMLIDIVYGLKGTQVFRGDGQLIDGWGITGFIRCYIEALRCSDWKAHCHILIRDPFKYKMYSCNDEGIELTHVFPCRLIAEHHSYMLYKNHPSSINDQIEALAVRENCDCCPLFDKNNFRSVYNDIDVVSSCNTDLLSNPHAI